jgi:hypothetical protein
MLLPDPQPATLLNQYQGCDGTDVQVIVHEIPYCIHLPDPLIAPDKSP